METSVYTSIFNRTKHRQKRKTSFVCGCWMDGWMDVTFCFYRYYKTGIAHVLYMIYKNTYLHMKERYTSTQKYTKLGWLHIIQIKRRDWKPSRLKSLIYISYRKTRLYNIFIYQIIHLYCIGKFGLALLQQQQPHIITSTVVMETYCGTVEHHINSVYYTFLAAVKMFAHRQLIYAEAWSESCSTVNIFDITSFQYSRSIYRSLLSILAHIYSTIL